jgi:hypothetical protein
MTMQTQIPIYIPGPEECSLVHQYDSARQQFVSENLNCNRIIEVAPECAQLIVLYETWSYKMGDYQNQLNNSELVRDFSTKLFTVNHDDYGRGFLPGCYTSLTKTNFNPNLHKAIGYPVTYNEQISQLTNLNSSNSPNYLATFTGSLTSDPVRLKMARLFSRLTDFKITNVEQIFWQHSTAQKTSYISDILDGYFALCPRGWSPATYRLFEVMQLGRCPVIISDHWIPISSIDWKSCSVQIREKDIKHLPDLLRERQTDAIELGHKAKRVWESYFSPGARDTLILDLLLELQTNAHHIENSKFCNLSSTWSSSKFRSENNWTTIKKIQIKIRKVFYRYFQKWLKFGY